MLVPLRSLGKEVGQDRVGDHSCRPLGGGRRGYISQAFTWTWHDFCYLIYLAVITVSLSDLYTIPTFDIHAYFASFNSCPIQLPRFPFLEPIFKNQNKFSEGRRKVVPICLNDPFRSYSFFGTKSYIKSKISIESAIWSTFKKPLLPTLPCRVLSFLPSPVISLAAVVRCGGLRRRRWNWSKAGENLSTLPSLPPLGLLCCISWLVAWETETQTLPFIFHPASVAWRDFLNDPFISWCDEVGYDVQLTGHLHQNTENFKI